MFNNFYLKIMPFMRQCAKIRYSQTGHRRQYNMAHALCIMNNSGYRHTLRICNTHCFSTVAMVMKRASILRLNSHCFTCLRLITTHVAGIKGQWLNSVIIIVGDTKKAEYSSLNPDKHSHSQI